MTEFRTKIFLTIGQAGKKRIPTNILDFFVHNKPSEFYPNTLPPIPNPLYIFFKDLRIHIPNKYIYTLRDNTISIRKTAEDVKGTANRLADNIYYL
jgi:hypothetical protein